MKFNGTLHNAKVIGNYIVTLRKVEHEFSTYEAASEFLTKNGGTLTFKVDPTSIGN